jgi:threonine aldolase
VIDVDPTVERLQSRCADLLGKEAGIFVPSGTMANQIAVRLHCQAGDELICDVESHVYNYEQGAFAQLSGVATRTVEGRYGVLHVDQLRDLIRPDNEHMVRTRLVWLENTHNRGAGRIQPYQNVVEICRWAEQTGLRRHLDGARLFNAAVASGIAVGDWAQHFDTVSVCFSKGLGAPIGSLLAGPRDLIRLARRHRKVLGGSMRQVGIIAAGALYALDNHVARLAEDHAHAKILAEAIRATEGLELQPPETDTNMAIFRVDPALGTAAQLAALLQEAGVLVYPFGPAKIRAVTHLDVGEADVRRAGQIIRDTVEKWRL